MSENFTYEKFFEEKEGAPPPRRLRGAIGLLRDALKIYRSKFPLFLGILGIPLGLALVYCNLFYCLSHTNFQYSPLFSIFQFLLGLAFILLFLCAIIALVYSFRENIEIKEAYKKGWRLLTSSIWILFLFASITAGGIILAVIPGIIFLVWFSLTLLVLIFEEKRGFTALARSRQLVKGRFWGIFGRLLFISLILGIIVMAIIIGISWKIDYIPLSGLVGSVTGYVLQIFSLPLFLLYLYLIFEDTKEVKAGEPYKAPPKRAKLAYLLPCMLGTIIISFGIALIVFGIFFGRDIPPIDDSDLSLSKVEIPKEQNAFYELMEALNKEFLPQSPLPSPSPMAPSFGGPPFPPPLLEDKWTELFNDMLAGKRLLTKEAEELIARNQELFQRFERALSRPYFQLPQVEDPKKVDFTTLYPEFSKLRQLARWGTVKANYLLARGKEKEAFDWFLNVVKLGKMMDESPRPGGLIQYLVAKAIKEIGLNPLRKAIGETKLSPGLLKDYARKLKELASAEEDLKRALKIDYIALINSLSLYEKLFYSKSGFGQLVEQSDLVENSDKERSIPLLLIPSWARVYYKPNKTRLLVANYFRELIRNMDKTYKEASLFERLESERETIEEAKGKLREFFKFVFGENSIGKLLKTVTCPFRRVAEHKCMDRFYIEAMATIIALRAYQKERGYLPARLEELVPGYLSDVPLDPFDGKPLRYSREKKIIYSVGVDLEDNGGSIGEKGYWATWKDPTLVIDF